VVAADAVSELGVVGRGRRERRVFTEKCDLGSQTRRARRYYLSSERVTLAGSDPVLGTKAVGLLMAHIMKRPSSTRAPSFGPSGTGAVQGGSCAGQISPGRAPLRRQFCTDGPSNEIVA
jgi:hypothetical protein